MQPVRFNINLVGLSGWCYYVIRKIDLEKKEVYLESRSKYETPITCFDYNFYSILKEAKKGDYRFFIKKEEMPPTRFYHFQEVERTKSYVVGYLSLNYLSREGQFSTSFPRIRDIVTPNFYRYKGKNGVIYLSDVHSLHPEEELGMFDSIMIRPENYREDGYASGFSVLGYSIVGIKKHKGEVKNKPSGYNNHNLKISVWITREGNEFILGNTEDDLVGGLGFRLPSYHYRWLEDGETGRFDMYCLKL